MTHTAARADPLCHRKIDRRQAAPHHTTGAAPPDSPPSHAALRTVRGPACGQRPSVPSTNCAGHASRLLACQASRPLLVECKLSQSRRGSLGRRGRAGTALLDPHGQAPHARGAALVPRACAARHGVVPPSALPRPPRPPRRSRQRPASARCARGAGPATVLEKIVAGVQPAMLVKTVAEVLQCL